MKHFLLAAVLSFTFVGFSLLASNESLCRGFLPENDMQIPESYTNSGISQQEFNDVMDRYEAIYRPLMAKEGGYLLLNRGWKNATVNANATRIWNLWFINMYGGLARYPGMTADGMTLVVCHETGHHLGRQPYQGPLRWGWATNEGGADYFATLKCARKIFESDDNEKIVSSMTIEPAIASKCATHFQNSKEVAICMRSTQAGIVLARVLSSLSKDKAEPQIVTPDSKVVKRIFDAHPEAQCRLDTYFSGAICEVSAYADLDIRNYRVNSCVSPDFKDGLRPNCWFKPDMKD